MNKKKMFNTFKEEIELNICNIEKCKTEENFLEKNIP